MTKIINKQGLTNDGKTIVPCIYDKITPIIVDGKESDERFVATDGNAMFFLKLNLKENTRGTKHISDYHSIGDFENDIAIVSIYCERFGEKYALVNIDFDELTKFEYDNIERLPNKYFRVTKAGYQGVLNPEGKLVVDCRFSAVRYHAYENKFILDEVYD